MKKIHRTTLIIILTAVVVVLFFVLRKSTTSELTQENVLDQYPVETSCELIRQDTSPGGLYLIKHERCQLTEEMARTYINFDELGEGALPQEYYPMTLIDIEQDVMLREWGIDPRPEGFPLSAQDGAVGERWLFVFLDTETLLLEKRSEQDIRSIALLSLDIPTLTVSELFVYQAELPLLGFSVVEENSDAFIFTLRTPPAPEGTSVNQLSLDKETREVTVVASE